jgi:hypothetical protein
MGPEIGIGAPSPTPKAGQPHGDFARNNPHHLAGDPVQYLLTPPPQSQTDIKEL